MRQPLHAMFLHAHPDDESSKGAGTMARYVREGYRVSIVTFTDGGAGDILNPKMDRPGIRERLHEVRRAEMREALRVLGIEEHHALDFPDSGYVEGFDRDGSQLDPGCFYNLPLLDVLDRLVPILRATRPDVVVTYDYDGGYPHPDHIRTHQVTVAAVDAAADPAMFPDAGEPWHVRKLYWHATFNLRRVETLHDACLERGMDSPFAKWLDGWDRSVPDPVTTSVDCTGYVGIRNDALRAHATQVDPDGFWFSLPDEVVEQVYPWEDYTLAASTVPTPEGLERSLFESLE